ncbi:MAG: heavy metal-binding domain-containing protein [Anaerolineae bacterium]|nr:heavy metal-binding domain-containing protein [Anaerolineae bacterium]
MLSANELYKIAYDIHYKKKNFSVAYAIYSEIVNHYPNSEQAKYAVVQKNNITSAKNIVLNSSDDIFQLARKVINGEQVEIEPENLTEEEIKMYKKRQLVNSMLLTTGFDFQGYKITAYHDVIFDELIAGMGILTSLKSIGNSFASLTGEELSALSERLNELKTTLKDRVIRKAIDMGANALLGIDFESSVINSGTIMVSITATAVTIEKTENRP